MAVGEGVERIIEVLLMPNFISRSIRSCSSGIEATAAFISTQASPVIRWQRVSWGIRASSSSTDWQSFSVIRSSITHSMGRPSLARFTEAW